MKLCPQCEFIYEDEQKVCDMDGEALVYDTRLGVVPGTVPAIASATRTKLRLTVVVVPVVAGLALSAFLSVAYYASSPLFKADIPSRSRNPEAPATSLYQPIAPPLEKSSPPPLTEPSQSPTNAAAASASVSIGADELTEKPESQSARSHAAAQATKATDNRLTIARRLPPLRQLSPLPELPPLKRLPAAKPESRAAGSRTRPRAVVVDVKPVPGNAGKQSGVKGFLKKTARILKKPFQL
jgi:hypothetical protein